MTRTATIIDAAAKAIDTILDPLERGATVDFRAVLWRKGTEIAMTGDGITMQNVHELVCGVDDDRNQHRAMELDTAWAGLPGWRS